MGRKGGRLASPKKGMVLTKFTHNAAGGAGMDAGKVI